MTDPEQTTVRALPPSAFARPSRAVQVVLVAFCVLTAAGFTSLVVLAGRTAETFAWTIQPPVSAAFLGSGYGAGFVLSLLAVRAGDWDRVRVPYLTVLVFTWFTALATALHAELLHMSKPGTGPVATPAAWVWVVVYVVVPVAMLVTLLHPRGAAPPGAVGRQPVPLPRWLAGVLAVLGVEMLVVGAVLFVDPTTTTALWPWDLTPFVARAAASWLLAFGVAAALCLHDGDLARLQVATAASATFSVLQLVTLVRFADDVIWSRPSAVVYTASLVALGLAGAVGYALGGSGRSAPHP